MTQNKEVSIELMNVSIAAFAGWENDDTGYFKAPSDLKLPYTHYKGNGLLFHSDWNWLMPVVEKIAKTVAMQQGFTVPKNDYELDAFEILRRPIYTAISTIHDDAYKFITWYNTTLKK